MWIAFRGSLCVPNTVFESSPAGDTAAGTPTIVRISQQSMYPEQFQVSKVWNVVMECAVVVS